MWCCPRSGSPPFWYWSSGRWWRVVSTLGTDLTRGERGFIGWMAPRGIVAAATASTFSSDLVAKGIGGASKILPATFVVIVATVTLYGLTASPVARRLGVVRPARSRPLLVGGDPWVVDLGVALQSAGLEVLMWAGAEEQRERIRGPGSNWRPVSCWPPPPVAAPSWRASRRCSSSPPRTTSTHWRR